MTSEFRRDVGGRLNFNFRHMPMAGAFNMLLNEYELTYLFDPSRKLVRIVPMEAVVFPPKKKSTRAVTVAAKPKKTVSLPKSKPLWQQAKIAIKAELSVII